MPAQHDPQEIELKCLHNIADLTGAHVLEIGCGDGRLTWRYTAAAGSVVATDPNPLRLAAARREWPPALRVKLAFTQTVAQAAPFRGETFDLALLAWSLWWVPHQSMVHALQETWRVLKPGGTLIDLRPLAANSPVQIVAGKQVRQAGRIDDSRDRLDDTAASKALTQVLRDGWFVCEREETFNYISYWDTLADMKIYIEEKRSSLILPEAVLAKAARLLVDSGTEARLRIPFKMVIARYRKQAPPHISLSLE